MTTPNGEKTNLLKRLSRIRGQVEALRRALEAEASIAAVLQQATVCRGALDGFIAEVIEDRIREQAVDADDRASGTQAAEELIGIVRSYLTYRGPCPVPSPRPEQWRLRPAVARMTGFRLARTTADGQKTTHPG